MNIQETEWLYMRKPRCYSFQFKYLNIIKLLRLPFLIFIFMSEGVRSGHDSTKRDHQFSHPFFNGLFT